ncbi:D-alanyl-D-alanine carboxypeptidase [Flagellimonas nanhaiensis]|uniref:D-alanyl-D-alanine carboxypeptidase n=1 Tax=Flagellimonas nanhaiensis TaxID=2292706 RepID=A0A371JTN1_9FLAO|nr:D-alanyl-D-alanine carboxypeptidase [Allomuricauda nanhaiensis]RDY61164.1 D-alanyl-D-alanine carboxypeptidase [Allomuricauda nanhaiensis]
MSYRPDVTSKYLIIKILLILFLLQGCSPLRKSLDSNLHNSAFQNSLHGLVVLDADTKKTIYDHNGAVYFTPASNVKIATFYSCTQLIPKHVPSLKYLVDQDTLYIEGTGDPTWLHPYFHDTTTIDWLKKQQQIALYLNNTEETRYGPGWAWEDFDTYFSPEKGSLPLYGNVVSIAHTDSLKVLPRYFKDAVAVQDHTKYRDEFFNRFYIAPMEEDTLEVPFITDQKLTKELLEQILDKKITITDEFPSGTKKIRYGMETDSIYKQMLLESDNFLAEQLMMMASSVLSDTLGTKRVITHSLENSLKDLQHEPRWVDGSGLSRYNLFTPRSMVEILQKLYIEIPQDHLFAILPMWDSSGTVEKWQDPDTAPFVFAKSGSLGNNYNLSGYVLTKSGKLLIFSFMNNHFRVPTSKIRDEIYSTLKKLHEDY